PEDIVHPRSSLWLPPPEVADYVESHIRHSFDKDVRSRLRSECPRPDFPYKVTETPELDPTLVTFLKKSAEDLKKGIDRVCRGCQDKLLDVSGPLTKILELAFQAKESGEAINPDVLVVWAQRALCFLGNANCAISLERRRSVLMKLDPKLADLATSESGPVARGLLSGSPFIKELSKFVATYASLDMAQESIRRVLRPLFRGAGRYRGRAFGRFNQQSPQPGYCHQGRGGFQEYDSSSSTFYPSRPRSGQSRFRRGRS
ncbi:hypothetical protein NDU88_009264, partial [Pleurodeles waltl]